MGLAAFMAKQYDQHCLLFTFDLLQLLIMGGSNWPTWVALKIN